MTIGLLDAISSLKADEKYIPKLLIGGLLAMLPIACGFIASFTAHILQNNSIVFMILLMFLMIAIGAYLSGFIFATGNQQLNSDSLNMADWKDGSLFVKGIKTIFAYIIYSIIIMIVSFVVGFVSGFLIALLSGVINAVNATAGNIFTTLFFIVFEVVLGLVIALFMNTASASFLINLNIGDMLALNKHFGIIKENQHACWTLIGKMILYSLLFILISVILTLFVITSVLLPFVYFMAYVVYVNLLVQFGKEINIKKYFIQ